jgi:hypothetical protein
MLAFAVVFSMLVEGSVTVAFVSASVAWLVVSVAAWFVRRKLRFVPRPRMGEGTHSSTMSRSHSG